MDKSVIINGIIKETKSESYLEIGYGNGHNFKRIECSKKSTCDPETVEMDVKDDKGNVIKTFKPNSDEYFSLVKDNFDCIFIDGLHHADQVRKDIINSLKLNPNVIILHDTLPKNKLMAEVPRKQLSWTGDVWRAVVGFHENYPDVKIETYRADYGLTCIYPEGKKVKKHFEEMEMTYEDFKANEVELLNILD